MRDRIKAIWRHAARPLNALWKWAKRPEKFGRKADRFGALRRWAADKRDRARKWGERAKARVWGDRASTYRDRERFFRDHAEPEPPASGVGTFDGRACAAWIIPWLEKSRRAGWRGYLVSGYRSPEYSESLCYSMCGAPSCPGRCAGRASNHAGSAYPAGAVDVSDYANFGAIQRRIGSPLINALGAQDPVHFSISGR
ncbi:MAG: hypothetical protein ACREMB_21185 [Candidatus Rokuibacteriota bacterium]